MARPLASGPLWEHLLDHCAPKLIVVTTIDDLRSLSVGDVLVIPPPSTPEP